MELDRRELLTELGIFVVALRGFVACRKPPEAGPDAVASLDAAKPVASAPAWKNGDHALLPMQRAVLGAAVARILPTDRDPGAADADVIEFIDRELARPEHSKMKDAMVAGVVALNRNSQRNGVKSFTDLKPEEQDQVLHMVESGSERGKDFVFMLVILTLEGFLADPQWGGNKGGVGWAMIGYGPGTVDGETPTHDHFYP